MVVCVNVLNVFTSTPSQLLRSHSTKCGVSATSDSIHSRYSTCYISFYIMGNGCLVVCIQSPQKYRKQAVSI